MKFLHAIAEVCLYLMHKNGSYVYLELDTTIGNFEVRIMTFIITTCPLQFTHCAAIRFFWHCLWNSVVTFTSSNSVLSDTIQNTALYEVQCRIFCSTLYYISSQFFRSDTCFSSLHTRARTHTTCTLRFPLQSSMCHWNSIYKLFFPYCLLTWAWIFHTALASNLSATFS
jgi:hypothetical protein